MVVLQIMGEYDWIERQLRAICTWTPGKKEIEILEDIRVIIPRDKTWGKVWYGTYSERSEEGQDFWDKNQANKRFYESYLYPDNLKEVLPYGGTIQYSGLAVIAEMQRKINVNSFITTFTRRRWMEYWIKAGLIKLAAEVTKEYGMWGNPSYIRESREKLTENLKINGNRLYRLKILDGGINALKWLQYEEEMEHQGKQMKISQESLSFLSKNNSTPDDCQEILKALGSINRMVNYIKKQNVSSNKLVSNWNDYLRMAEAEGMDVTDDIVRFPKDLKIRHDELVERINARRDAEKLKKQAKMYKGLNKGIIQHAVQFEDYRGNVYRSYATDIEFLFADSTNFSCKAKSMESQGAEYPDENKVLVEQVKEDARQKMTAYDIKLKQMNELAANTLGFYYTDEEQDDGSVISYVCKWLKAAGHEATLCIAPEGQLHSLNDEIKYFIEEEHKQNYDLSVQLHLNAFNGEAYGCEAYCYNANGLPEAQRISAKLGTVWHDRGAEERPGLYWTRKTKAKAVLVESFFCDNKDDYAKAKKLGMDAHGKLIAEGILGKTITIAPAQPKAKYYIQAGAYGTKENADAMVKVLKKKGFSASIRKVSGSVPYRVQVGTYRTKKAANKVVKKLKAAGFTVLVKSL